MRKARGSAGPRGPELRIHLLAGAAFGGSLLRRGLGGGFRRALGALRTLARPLDLAQARLERFHEIDDLGLRRLLRRGGDLLAPDLLLAERAGLLPHPLPVRL